MQGVTLQSDALEILDDHGFEPTVFQQVGYSIGMAMAAGDMTAEDKAALQESQDKLESMKGKMPVALRTRRNVSASQLSWISGTACRMFFLCCRY